MGKIEQAEKQMPVLMGLRKQYRKSLTSWRVGMCLHITKETAVLARTFQEVGCDVWLTASNPLSTQDDIVDQLKKEGIHVQSKHGESTKSYYENIRIILGKRQDFLIDDGADMILEAHKMRVDSVQWAQEETTTGVQRLRAKRDLIFPVIAVNDADTKHLFDNVYGTGQSVWDGIIRATGELIAGKTVVVAGYGHCGRGVAVRGRGLGATIIVTEINPVKALQALMDGYRVLPMQEAAEEGDIFITVTGCKDVITKEHFQLMRPGTIVCNAGHFDCEINMKDAKKYPKIRVLGEGRLVNLVCANGHPSAVMDMSFATQFLVAVQYANHAELYIEPDVRDVNQHIIQDVAIRKLESENLRIDTLTKEQQNYINSYHAGT